MMQDPKRCHHRRALIVCYCVLSALSFLLNGVSSLTINSETSATNSQFLKPVKSSPLPAASSAPASEVVAERSEASTQDNRRPIWNLAHMVNSIKELDYRLGKGANGVEVDVTFGREGDPLYTYHGPPCDCWRHCHQQEDFGEYLRYVRDLTTDGQDGLGANLSLMLLDLKLNPLDHKAKGRAGSELAKALVGNLYGGSTTLANDTLNGQASELRVVLSVNHVQDVELVNNFLHQLEQLNSSHLLERQIGFDVGMNDDLDQIEIMWRRFGGRLNLWQGDGYTNCLSPFYNLQRLSQALVKRNQARGYPRKVYQWTVDLHERMREALRLGVDAVMTNHPERLVGVLQEPELARDYRLASRRDDPFAKLPAYPLGIRARGSSASGVQTAAASESARYQRSAGAPGGGLLGGLMDMLSSWLTYLREIPFLSLPTTSRLLNGSKRHKSHQLAKSGSPTGQETISLRTRRSSSTSTSTSTTTTTTMVTPTASSSAPDEASTPNSNPSEGLEERNHLPATASSLQDQSGQTPNSSNEGPSWYASLASNLLVSALKFALPADT